MRMHGLPDDLVLELPRLSPLPDAAQAEAVVTIGQDPESLFTVRLLHNYLEANPATLLLRPGNGKREFHVLLVLFNTVLAVFLS